MAAVIIPSIWGGQPGSHFCVSTKSEAGYWRDEWLARNELNDAQVYARSQRWISDVYFCPNGFNLPKRRAELAVRGLFLYADLDEANPRKIHWKPTIALQSSPGRYVALWRVDSPINDVLNKRMTYAVGADRGGWDCTQLLRYPGTTNFKYPQCLRVTVLWDDGPDYRVRDLQRELPNVAPVTLVTALDVNPAAYRWRDVCRRRGVSERRVKDNRDPDRSRAIFRLAARLIERGATPDEVACVLLASPAYLSKWGNDAGPLRAEVSRLWAKLKRVGD